MHRSATKIPAVPTPRCLVIVPVFNESQSIRKVICRLRRAIPQYDVLVVGVPDAKWGQAVTAVVRPTVDARFDEATLRDHVRERELEIKYRGDPTARTSRMPRQGREPGYLTYKTECRLQ